MADTSYESAKALDDAYVMHTYGRLPVEFVSGSGATLADSTGKTYIDCLGGIGSVSMGHCNPVVAAALREQVDKIWQVGNYYYVENRGELAQDLSGLLSSMCDEEGHVVGSTGSTWKTFFANSGAEANEGAIKVARRWGEKKLGGATGILTAQKSFMAARWQRLPLPARTCSASRFSPCLPALPPCR